LILRKRLWLGPDHILMVSSKVLSQEYRRFYFADVEALIVAEVESAARFYGAVLSVIAVVLTLGLAIAGNTITAVFCGLIAIGLGIFTFTRPAVRCSIKTRVSREFLPSFRRLETARRVMDMLQTEIEKVQGAIPAESLAAHPHLEGPTIPPPLRPYKGSMHYATFAAMFAVVLLTPLRLNFSSVVFANGLAGMHIGMVALAIIAAVKQHGTAISRVARTVIAITLAWAAASFVTEQVIVASSIQAAFRNPMTFDYWRDPIWDVAVANAIAYAVFGLVGVFAMMSHHRAAAAT
jgi:hypothetical protein